MDEQEVAIGNFRSTHNEALHNPAHMEHGLRTAELTGMYERAYDGDGGAGARIEAVNDARIDAEILAHRIKHDAALSDLSHVENKQRAAELSSLLERKFGSISDAVGGDQPADDLTRLVEPAKNPSDYDFGDLRDHVPLHIETQPDESLEKWSREWLHAGGVSPAEAQALGVEYAQSLAWEPDEIDRMRDAGVQDLQSKYGADAPAVAAAALRVAAETPELMDFLERHNLLNSPRVVANLIKAAERRGYIQSKGQ